MSPAGRDTRGASRRPEGVRGRKPEPDAPASPPPTGVVLCGGASQRMGSDKATLDLAGKPLAIWVAAALKAAGADPVIAQGGTAPTPLVAEPDSVPRAGPLAALIDVLERHGDVLVCPTDVPTVSTALLTTIVEQASRTGVPVVLARSDRIEPLIGYYSQAVLGVLRAGYRDGARGPASVLDGLDVATVPAAAGDVLNVNTVDDLVVAGEILAARGALAPGAGSSAADSAQAGA
ncbi:molybdenum cofactor guanylyltransferase [Candidatus Poriferisodalis sp.]|uniref:molybdenum cofactor guanylyltransferase n=1 Tax=Candidatus Poriferisodalis sp. TaxID=3101277 RepID=UPI003B01B3DF